MGQLHHGDQLAVVAHAVSGQARATTVRSSLGKVVRDTASVTRWVNASSIEAVRVLTSDHRALHPTPPPW
jgi:hypothetical protein